MPCAVRSDKSNCEYKIFEDENNPPPKLHISEQEEEEDADGSSSHTVVQEEVGGDREPSDDEDDEPLSQLAADLVEEATTSPPKRARGKATVVPKAAARPTQAELVEVLADGQGLKMKATGAKRKGAVAPHSEEKAQKGEVDKKKRSKAVQKGQK